MTVQSHTLYAHLYVYVCICNCNWFALKSVRTLQCIAAPAPLGGTNNGNEICIGDAFRNRTKKLTRLFLLLLQLLMLLLLLWLCHDKSRMCMVPVYILTA